jgi:acetoin utilization deacetylase AcuC-like enzyme
MAAVIPYVWNEDVVLEADADRARAVRAALRDEGHPEVAAVRHDDGPLLAVHDAAMVRWLAETSGTDGAEPHLFPTPMMTSGMPWRYPEAAHARAGVWCYDIRTPIGPRTWAAARAAVDTALTAVDLVLAGTARTVYALTTTPGHHATPAALGGGCYLNHAAVAAQALAATGRRVAVLDLALHHGNGTQAAFWRRGDVACASLHVDPAAGFFPHVQGHAEETGDGEGAGTTLNLTLPPGAGDDAWLDGVRRLCGATLHFEAQALVVSLGTDAAADEPESPLDVSREAFAVAGGLLSELALPAVVVQEGGRDLTALAGCVAATLAMF